jgi:hypothetical protein
MEYILLGYFGKLNFPIVLWSGFVLTIFFYDYTLTKRNDEIALMNEVLGWWMLMRSQVPC